MSNTDFTDFAPMNAPDANNMRNTGYDVVGSGAKDDNKLVGFFYKAAHNRKKSMDSGLPVYDNLIFVRIQNPGEKDYIERAAKESDKQRWPRQWEAFQKGRKFVSEGTPLDMLFPDAPHIVSTISSFNIHTVQQLANLSGDAISRGGIGFQDWSTKAKKYIETASGGVDHHKYEKEKAALTSELDALKKQVSDMSSQMSNMMKMQPTQAQYRPAPQPEPIIPANHDFQSELTANSMAADFSGEVLPAANFTNAPDLGASVTTATKRRGRPAGSKNKPKGD